MAAQTTEATVAEMVRATVAAGTVVLLALVQVFSYYIYFLLGLVVLRVTVVLRVSLHGSFFAVHFQLLFSWL